MLFDRPRYELYQTIEFKQFINENDVFQDKGVVMGFGFVAVKETYIVEYIIDVNGKKYSIMESDIQTFQVRA